VSRHPPFALITTFPSLVKRQTKDEISCLSLLKNLNKSIFKELSSRNSGLKKPPRSGGQIQPKMAG